MPLWRHETSPGRSAPAQLPLRTAAVLRRRARAGGQIAGRAYPGPALRDLHERADALAHPERPGDRCALADHLQPVDPGRIDLAEERLLDARGGRVVRVAVLPLVLGRIRLRPEATGGEDGAEERRPADRSTEYERTSWVVAGLKLVAVVNSAFTSSGASSPPPGPVLPYFSIAFVAVMPIGAPGTCGHSSQASPTPSKSASSCWTSPRPEGRG